VVWAVLSADALDCFAHVLKPWWWWPEPVGGRRTRRAVHTRCGRGAPSTGTGHGLKRWSTREPACGLSTRLAGGQACCPRRASHPQPQPRGLCDGIHRWCCGSTAPCCVPGACPPFCRCPFGPSRGRLARLTRNLFGFRPSRASSCLAVRGRSPAGLRPFELPTDLSFAAVVKASRPCPAGGLRPALTLRQRTPCGCMGSAVLRA
jgi:hypothetical protein